MENHIYCCNRCGTIFESERDEDFCESCRALFRRSRPRTSVYLHECELCGKKYRSKSKTPARTICPDCKAAEQRMKADRLSPPKILRRTQPAESISEICRQAELHGMTYGEFVAKYR